MKICGGVQENDTAIVQDNYSVGKKVMQWAELVERLRRDYPELRFREGRRFMYRPPRTVTFEQFYDRAGGNEQKNVSATDGNEAGKKLELDNSPDDCENEQNHYILQLLHEVGHAVLGHRDFVTDPERIKMECAAWEKARELARKYDIYYDEEYAESKLDTYRDWLFQRSKCPKCGMTRYQDTKGEYHCPLCENF